MYDVTTVNVRGCLLLPVVCYALSKVNRLFTSDMCIKKVFNLTIDRNSEILLHFWSIGLHRIDVNNICKLPSTSKSLCDTMSVVALPLNDLCLTCVSRNLLITFFEGIGWSWKRPTVQLFCWSSRRWYVPLASNHYGAGRLSLLWRCLLPWYSLPSRLSI